LLEEFSGTIGASDQMRQLLHESRQKVGDCQCSEQRNRSYMIVHFVKTTKTC